MAMDPLSRSTLLAYTYQLLNTKLIAIGFHSGIGPKRHFLEVAQERVGELEEITPKRFLEEVTRKRQCSLLQIAAKTGINRETLYRVMRQEQYGMYPATQQKLKRLVAGDLELENLWGLVDWGEAAKERKERGR